MAHEIAKECKGNTIAVVGCGLNYIYPEENTELFKEILRNDGCIVSEYEPDEPVNMRNFPRRNRIISGIANAVLVIEAGSRSGSTITGRFGLEQGKHVFCLPRDIGNTKGIGTNDLIKEGATLTTDPLEILQKLGIRNSKKKKEIEYQLRKTEKVEEEKSNIPKEYIGMYKLVSYIPQNIQNLSKRSGLSIAEVTQKLIMLELQGYIKSMPRKLLYKDIIRCSANRLENRIGENMYQRHIIGKSGEEIATKYLLKNDYTIIERNFCCRQGEIDIIAQDKNEIVFIEVKTRTNKNYGEPIEAVTYYKQKHIIKSVQYYLYIKKLQNAFIRIDIIEIYQKTENKYHINHIKNAIEE